MLPGVMGGAIAGAVAGAGGGGGGPSVTPLQYVLPTALGPVFVNESASADLQFVLPGGVYLNESEG